MQRRVHVWVTGRVQGVFFRAATRQCASGLGLTGWVRNLDDGRVELVAEGDANRIEQLLAWCRLGPPRARVDLLTLNEETPDGSFVTFDVLPDRAGE